MFDRKVTQAMAEGELLQFLTMGPALCGQAAECGLDSFQIMAGALEGQAVEAKLLSLYDNQIDRKKDHGGGIFRDRLAGKDTVNPISFGRRWHKAELTSPVCRVKSGAGIYPGKTPAAFFLFRKKSNR